MIGFTSLCVWMELMYKTNVLVMSEWKKSALPSGVKKETKMEMALEGFEPMISDSYAKQEVAQVLKML